MKRTILSIILMILCTLLLVNGVLAEEPIVETEVVETEVTTEEEIIESDSDIVIIEEEVVDELLSDEEVVPEESTEEPEIDSTGEAEPEKIEDEPIATPIYVKFYSDKAGQVVDRGELIVLKAITNFEGDYTIRWESTPDGGKTVCVMGYGPEFSFRASDENVNWLWRAVLVVN